MRSLSEPGCAQAEGFLCTPRRRRFAGAECGSRVSQINLIEETLRAHRAEIARLQIGRDELPSKFYCCITTEVMSDPCMAADGHTYEVRRPRPVSRASIGR